MNPKQVVAMWLLYRRIKRRKIKRKYWIHPINQGRGYNGTFHTLFLFGVMRTQKQLRKGSPQDNYLEL
nr:unnamed protein product [Callosobruchus chinensis]